MVKFLHTGDIHLGLKFRNSNLSKEKAEERRNELWSTFSRILDYTKTNSIDFLFIAGDLFEEDYFSLLDLNRLNAMFESIHNTNIIISAGNHDTYGLDSLYRRIVWPENVTIFDNQLGKIEFPDKNLVVYGYSWDFKTKNDQGLLLGLKDRLDKDKRNVLIIHGDVLSSSEYLNLNMKDLEALGMDYIGLGHIHKPQFILPNIAYCGSPEPLNFGETGQRGFIEGQFVDKDLKTQFIPFSKRTYLYFDLEINENMTQKDILDEIDKLTLDRNDDFIRIDLKGLINSQIDLDQVKNQLGDKYYYIDLVDNTNFDYDLDGILLENENNIIYDFIKEMESSDLDNRLVKRSLYLGLNELLKR